MKSLLIFLFPLLSAVSTSISIEQKPDLLIIGQDTMYLRSFPLEELDFKVRPFRYGVFNFPNSSCIRGYQATWKVIGKKLFLTEIVKADVSQERIDLVQYFAANEYSPVVIDGVIFADWFTMDLQSFPRDFGILGCYFKSYKPKKYRTCLKFEEGILVYNKYRRLI